MKLYYAPGACSLAAHIILNEINVDFDLVRVDLKTHLTEKGVDYYQINPKGYVPALEINPGLILTEIVAILPFLAQHDPKQDLIPPSGFGRAKVLEWLGYLNSELHDAYAVFFQGELDEAAKKKAMQRLIIFLVILMLQLPKLSMNIWWMIILVQPMRIYLCSPIGQKPLGMI